MPSAGGNEQELSKSIVTPTVQSPLLLVFWELRVPQAVQRGWSRLSATLLLRSGRSHAEPKGLPQTGRACGAVTQPRVSRRGATCTGRPRGGGQAEDTGCGGRMGPVCGAGGGLPPPPPRLPGEPRCSPWQRRKREISFSFLLQGGCHCAGVTCAKAIPVFPPPTPLPGTPRRVRTGKGSVSPFPG